MFFTIIGRGCAKYCKYLSVASRLIICRLYGNPCPAIVAKAKIPGCNEYAPATTSNEKSLDLTLFMEEVQKYDCRFTTKFSTECRHKHKKNDCWKANGEKFDLSPDQAEKNIKNTRTANARFLKIWFWKRERIGHFRVPPGPLFQNEGRCSAFDMEIIFHSHASKTHFHKKGCAPGLILKVRVFGTRKWPI